MDALIERYKVRLLGAVREIAADRSVSVCERIVRAAMAMDISGGGREILKHIHKPQNALMHQKMQKVIISGLTPIMAGIVREGVEQGQFSTPFPYECMEMILAYASIVFDDTAEMAEEERALRIQAFVFNTERLLGAERGSLMRLMQVFGGGNREDHE